MDRKGLTLVEVMVSVSILTLVAGILYTLSVSFKNAYAIQEAQVSAQEQVRSAAQAITREIRQAAFSSIDASNLPGPVLTYQTPADLDGNGVPVNAGMFLELGPTRTISRDTNDLNNDRQLWDQLILDTGQETRVLANGLMQDEDANLDGTLGNGEDTNNNGTLERGIWFEVVGQGIQFTLDVQYRITPDTPPMTSSITKLVVPRN